MSEFKFSCPNCQQNIAATPEYSGMQINCPSCQSPIVVPQIGVTAPASAPKGKLTKAESTVHQPATSPVMQAQIIRKTKKPRTKLYVGLGVAAAVVGAAILFIPKGMEKYQQHKDEVEAAKKAAEAPPPPPPDLTADEILQKVGERYKTFPSYSTKGESVGRIDMSEIVPSMTQPQIIKTKFSILLSRPNLYRIEWDRGAGPRSTRGAVWSAGKGDFVRTGYAPMKMKDKEAALNMAGTASGLLAVGLAPLFFDTTNSLAKVLKDYAKTNNETLDGEKCYVLTAHVASHQVLYWIHKDDFLIVKCKLFLGGKLDDSELAGLNTAQKLQAEKMSKLKGDIVETYDDIETNKTLSANDFQKELKLNAEGKKRKQRAPRERPQ